jgi:hypothetical protein
MNAFRQVAAALLVLSLSGAAFAQDRERGSLPPGQSKDGSAPSDGAIKGGTILPGESGGTPDGAKARSRCGELSGTLREDCLKQERDSGAGATTGRTDGETQPSPPLTAPPQNPR